MGADPWLGEGLSVALATGILAADAAAEGLARGELDFADFGARIRESAVGRRMQRSLARADGFFEAAARAGGLDGYFGGGVR